jgi:hypothetical protein
LKIPPLIVVNCEFASKTTDVKAKQSWNGLLPILVTVDGILIVSNLSQPLNAESPIVWRPVARVILVKLPVKLNALELIVVNCVFGAKTIDVKRVQLSNGREPIVVTLDGMVIVVKLVQPLNALLPIVVTVDGIVILGNLV